MYHKLVSVLLVLSVVLSLCNGAAFYPKTLRTQKGSACDTPLSALQTKDQKSSQDSWNKYVEFYGSSTAYQGVFTFDVSDASSVSAYTLDVNFKGPKASDQVWQFEFYQPSSDSWVLAGDNSDADDWVWTALSFCGQADFSSLVTDGVLQVRFSSTTKFDDCDLDYLAISVTEGDAATSAPTSAPSNPTSAPTTKPTSAPSNPTSAPTSKPTSKPTAEPTSKPTSAPTSKPTSTPTSKPTSAPTTKPTSTPTSKPTSAPTSKPTSAPTSKPTSAPTTKPTTAPTTKPTSAPTTKPTTAPTTKPTSAPTTAPSTGGRICPAGQVWAPAPGTTWQWQLTGTIDQTLNVQMYDIDLFDNTAATITSLHSKGRAVICYFSTQYENWRPDAADFTSAVLGNNLDDWPGERYVDITSTVVRNIMTARLDLAVTKGCDGVEPDNVDSYSNSNGLGITAAEQLDFNRFLATEAHKRGLSVGLKNDLDQVTSLVTSFDWALNEQCNEYDECDDLKSFVTAGKAVFGVEYTGSVSKFCPTMATDKFSWLLKDLDLDASVTSCCSYTTAGCTAQATHQCVSYSSKRSIVDGVEVEELVAEPAQAAETEAVEQFDSAAYAMLPTVAITLAAVAALVL